jgi:hypothetical protein
MGFLFQIVQQRQLDTRNRASRHINFNGTDNPLSKPRWLSRIASKPVLESLRFKPQKRLEMALSDPDNTFRSNESIIVGQHSAMEQGVKRMLMERERKIIIWLFLQNHPRYLGALFSALGMFIFAAKAAVENFIRDDSVWADIAIRSLKMLGVAIVFIGLFFLALHLTKLRQPNVKNSSAPQSEN